MSTDVLIHGARHDSRTGWPWRASGQAALFEPGRRA
jgi:hypothetical protein